MGLVRLGSGPYDLTQLSAVSAAENQLARLVIVFTVTVIIYVVTSISTPPVVPVLLLDRYNLPSFNTDTCHKFSATWYVLAQL